MLEVPPEQIPIKRTCDPTEVALKSYFLGPQSENAEWVLSQIDQLFQSWFSWRRGTFPEDGIAIGAGDQKQDEFQARQKRVHSLLIELTERFEMELPKFSPRYVGHMFSELSVPALLGHILTVLHNPNIVARESATVAADIENEGIEALGSMVGMDRSYGHFTSGGTVANFEAVVRTVARLHAWLAVGAASGKHDLFASAHLGWDRYDELRKELTEDQLAPFLPELSGPYQAARSLEETFGTTFLEPALIVPQSAHYSWRKAARIFGVGEQNVFQVRINAEGRYEVPELKRIILECAERQQSILAVVSVAGTTETGAIDPIDEIDALLTEFRETRGWHIWHHIDAAYGGFFCTLLRESPGFDGSQVRDVLSPTSLRSLEAVGKADSVTLDPHKLGYVPYSCGTFLSRNFRDYTSVRVLAPYLDYEPTDDEVTDRGPYTLEGSRSAAGAVATWLTSRSIGLHQSGYGLLLARTVRQKQKVEEWLQEKLSDARVYPGCHTNLLCFCLANSGEKVSVTNERTRRIHERLASESLYYLTKTEFPLVGPHSDVAKHFVSSWQAEVDTEQVVVLRMCLMNPFFDSSELELSHIERLVFSLCEFSD